MDTNGNYSDFLLPSYGPSTYNYSQDPYYLTIGGDGNIWFTEWVGGNVARLVPSTGVITEFPVPYASPMGIASGPDKNIWFTDYTADSVEEFVVPTLGLTLTNSQFVLTWPAWPRTTPSRATPISSAPTGLTSPAPPRRRQQSLRLHQYHSRPRILPLVRDHDSLIVRGLSPPLDSPPSAIRLFSMLLKITVRRFSRALPSRPHEKTFRPHHLPHRLHRPHWLSASSSRCCPSMPKTSTPPAGKSARSCPLFH